MTAVLVQPRRDLKLDDNSSLFTPEGKGGVDGGRLGRAAAHEPLKKMLKSPILLAAHPGNDAPVIDKEEGKKFRRSWG